MRKLLVILMAMVPMALWAQFAPAAGQPGTTAMHADSSAFVAWATDITVERGLMQINNPSLGYASYGPDITDALGAPDGVSVVSLGDGGSAVLTFGSPICNGEGPDFAVFENGFENAQQSGMYFLELGFVEVSSDGVNFFRFPAITRVQTETQLGGFACIDPCQIHNFAGKYAAMYGTPFDLDDVEDNPLLDKNNVTHVKIIDVIGNIDPEYATYDSEDHPVNDPFDLDAVGVIHDIEHLAVAENEEERMTIYPNPAHDVMTIETHGRASQQTIIVCDVTGRVILTTTESRINVSGLEPGVYFVRVGSVVKRLIIR